jgi:hypothetical protein
MVAAEAVAGAAVAGAAVAVAVAGAEVAGARQKLADDCSKTILSALKFQSGWVLNFRALDDINTRGRTLN